MSRTKIGDTFTTNNCGNCVVIEYINSKKVKVKFITTGYECWCQTGNLKEGQVKDPYSISVQGIGYIGEGVYLRNINSRHTREYSVWSSMLERCYNMTHSSYPRYGGRGVTVCKEWHNFQNFAAWVVKQPNYNKDGFQLDKDLRISDSKEYSPNTCSFVPIYVNTILISNNKNRGMYPVGVNLNKDINKFRSGCYDYEGKRIFLGYYQTPEEAFQAYKTYKENLIKEVALEEYNKGNITEEVYNNLINWEVVPFPE